MRNLSIIFTTLLFSTLFCATEEEDIEAFNRWMQTKPLVTVKKDKGDLTIGGEVRVEYQNDRIKEIRNQEDEDSKTRWIPQRHKYDVEINLMLDYKADRMWGAVKLEFDNKMGSEGGDFNKICLEKAFFGGRLIEYPTFSLDAEVGRRALCNAFTSKVQFGSRFDGALIRTDKAFRGIGDLYASTAVFLVSGKNGRYAEAFETGFMDILNKGIGVQYSVINWKKNPFTEEEKNTYNFLVSQLTLSTAFQPVFLDKEIKPYIAGLINTSARSTDQSKGKLANLGYYTGFSIGKIKKKGDWSFDANYQYVQAQVIPEFDAAGIGKGNPDKKGFYTTEFGGNGDDCTAGDAVGKNNYHGVKAELQYALYDNLTVFNCLQIGSRLDPEIGPDLHYKQFEVELIYSF